MNDLIQAFLTQLDESLTPFAKENERFEMYLLGRAALVLGHRFPLTTKDVDIVRLNESELEKKAIELFGKGSEAARALGIYLELVARGLPPLPGGFRARSKPLDGEWKVLSVRTLEVHDLATTKLKSFRPQDREDLQMLCDRSLLEPHKLKESLEDAFQFRSQKDEDAEDDPDNPDWTKANASCKRVIAYLEGSIDSI